MTDTKILQHEATTNRAVSQARTKGIKRQDKGTVQTAHEKESKEAKILIVDERCSVRQALTRLINDQPHFTVAAEAESAEQAVETVSKQEVDLVIADVSVEGAGRVQLTEEMKSRCPHVPVLVLPVSEFLEQ